MKKPLIPVLVFVLAATLMQSCMEDENRPAAKEKVQFSFALPSPASPGGRTDATSLPDDVMLRVSLTTTSGDPVLTDHTISLLSMGYGYISDPLDLHPGRYVLTDFMIVRGDTEVLYATPRQGAPLSAAVSHALPYSFVVSKNQLSNVAMEVISTQGSVPEDFGYASFDITIVNPWRISAFAEEGGKLTLTNANAYLFRNSTLEYAYQLDPNVNNLTFSGDPESTYTLVVVKEGYGTTHVQDFRYDDIAGGGNQPITVVFREDPDEPAFTFQGQSDFIILFEASGSLVVNWGDGTAEKFDFVYSDEEGAQNVLWPYHDYLGERKPVVITGDLHVITFFSSSTIEGSGMTSMNTTYLTALERLRLVGADMDVLDLSANLQLTSLELEDSAIDDIQLGSPHLVSNVVISSAHGAGFNEDLLDDVYENAVSQQIKHGTFSINSPVSPSAAAMQKLDDLADNYQWSINYPDPPIE